MGKLELSKLGELGLIEVVRRRARGAAPHDLGIGDDAALLRPRHGYDWVVTTDALIEDVHFRWRTTSARELGRKALAVNLSDLAAMGARPRGFLLTWGLPEAADPRRLDGLLSGLLAEARAAECPLLGGDTVRAAQWMLSITAFGEVERGRALLRSGARPGDRVLVTGSLGGAGLGLALLESGRERRAGAAPFIRRHRAPKARLDAGQRLVKQGWATAAMDVSDGLGRDLDRIARASGVAVRVDLDQLPLARGLKRWAAELGLVWEELALGGGEDYELLFCVRPMAPSASRIGHHLGCPVREIGAIERGRGVHFMRNRSQVSFEDIGYEHFKRIPGSSDK